jgi:outer membrane lipoprotein-sorting protein
MKKSAIIAVTLFCLSATGWTQSEKDKFHHPAIPGSKINYDSLFEIAVVLEKSEEGQKLVSGLIKRYGGKDKLANLKSCHLTYAMTALMSKQEIEVTKSFADNRRYRIFRKRNSGFEQRILNGKVAWYKNQDNLMSLDGGRYNAELFSYLTLNMPSAIWDEPFSSVRFGTRADDSLQYIYMKKNDTLIIIVGIHPEDQTIRSSEGLIYQGHEGFTFINRFSDFKEFDGYLFPVKLTNISMGLEVARSTLSEVKINPKFGPDEFNVSAHTADQDTH